MEGGGRLGRNPPGSGESGRLWKKERTAPHGAQ